MAREHRPGRCGGDHLGALSLGEQNDVELALALGLDGIAERLFAGDLVERAFWSERLAGAAAIAAARDERLADLVADALVGE